MSKSKLPDFSAAELLPKGSIDGKVRNLPKADHRPTINLFHGCRPQLTIVRNGNVGALRISRRVAEELIAMGLAYGN